MDIKKRLSGLDNSTKIVAGLLILLLTGFVSTTVNDLGASGQHYEASGDVVRQTATSADAAETSSGSSTSQKIITTVQMTLKVDDVDAAMNDVESEVRSMNGFVESSSRSKGGSNRGMMTVAVPEDRLSEFEEDVEGSYRIESRNVDRTDVTDNYNELETEIESLRTEHQRLRELINRTDEVETLIKIQERLSQVRSQINYKQQRLDRLEEDISYSKVYITFEGPESFESRFDLRQTFTEAYQAVFDSFKLIVIGAAYLLPFAAIYGLYRLIRRVKDRGF